LFVRVFRFAVEGDVAGKADVVAGLYRDRAVFVVVPWKFTGVAPKLSPTSV
jgi:hypothetical protein